jgi:23S rRNA pseudouridine2605 synthase
MLPVCQRPPRCCLLHGNVQVLAGAGVAARRDCIQLIKDGKVKVNDDLVTNPATKVTPGQDTITVKGRRITVNAKPHLYYFAVNKPSGYICSMVSSKDPDKRVVDLLNKWLAEKGAKLAKKVRKGTAHCNR